MESHDQSSFSFRIYYVSLLELDVCIVSQLHLIITREMCIIIMPNKLEIYE